MKKFDGTLRMRKAYGYRSFELRQTFLNPRLADLPKPHFAHRFCRRAKKTIRHPQIRSCLGVGNRASEPRQRENPLASDRYR